jgi:hypothetical protein
MERLSVINLLKCDDDKFNLDNRGAMIKQGTILSAIAILLVTRVFGTIFAAECQQTTSIQDGNYRLLTEQLPDATNGVSDSSKSGVLISVKHGQAKVVASLSPQPLDGFSGSFDRANDSSPWLLTLRRGDDSIVQFWKCLEQGVFLVRSVPDFGQRQLAMLEGAEHWSYAEVLNTVQFGAQEGNVKSTSGPMFELTVVRNGPLGNFEQDVRTRLQLGQHFQVESWTGGTSVMRISGTLEKREGSANTFTFRNPAGTGIIRTMELVLDKPFGFGLIHGPSWTVLLRKVENE